MTGDQAPVSTDILLTKIIATLGPASREKQTIHSMIREGVRVFRINFSHGGFDEYDLLLVRVREAEEEAGVPVGVLGDIAGPKIRIGEVVAGGVDLENGATVEFAKLPTTAGKDGGGTIVFSTTYPGMVDEVVPGQIILLDDGNVRLRCSGKRGTGEDTRLACTVLEGGLITSRKGVNLPDIDLSLPSLTERDYRCVDFAIERGFDFLALSFVRRAEDVRHLKDYLRRKGGRPDGPTGCEDGSVEFRNFGCGSRSFTPVIAKIEKPQALEDLDTILEETDGIMVARGDLGVEMDLAEVAVHQKHIISLCRSRGIPVIVATQMLESMIHEASPTRAEVSDVANAIFDGVDAVMLSGETAVGRYPVGAVRMMVRIAAKTTAWIRTRGAEEKSPDLRQAEKSMQALAHGVEIITDDLDARFIAIWSHRGGGAVYLSRQRISRPVLACSPNREILRRMSLLYGLIPIGLEQPANTADFLKQVDGILENRRWSEAGDPVVAVLGEPIEEAGRINKIVIHRVGESHGPHL